MNAGTEKIKEWRLYPPSFVRDVFDTEPDPWQFEVLEEAGGEYRTVRRQAMKACTGPGKSAVLSWLGWIRMLCYCAPGEHPKGAALAITKDNLRDNLWAELAKWRAKSDLLTSAFEQTKEKIYARDHEDTWFLSARSYAQSADAEAIGRTLSGLHSHFPFVLLDEIGDMPLAVGRSADQIFTGSPVDAFIGAAGNPTSTDGLLYEICTNLLSDWFVTTITADPDDPKRTPRVSVELARKQIETHGKDNPWVMATILGLFPLVGFNQLLGVEEVRAAMERHYTEDQYSFAAKILGCDVARMGDDRSCIFPRQGLVALKPKIFRNLKSHELAGHLARMEDEWQADGVCIDGTGGWGSGVIDAYEVMGRECFDIQFSGTAFDPAYYNRRAEMWFLMAEWVKKGGAIPYIPELVKELTAPTYTFKGDKMILEPKDKIKERIGVSPDVAEGLALTFAQPIQKRDLLQRYLDKMQPGSNQAKEYDPFQGM